MASDYIIKGVTTKIVTTGLYAAGIQIAQKGVVRDKPLYTSKIGTPVYSDLTIDEFTYTVNGQTFIVPKLQLYTMILTTSGAKNIVKTPIQGLKGTIKEYISDGDDVVIIEGTITGKNGIYPYQEVADLKALINAPVAFKVVSRFLQNLDIDTLVIETYDLPQMEGGYSYQKFKLYCVTDIPVELNIVSESNTTA
jgi:hypothetical protein